MKYHLIQDNKIIKKRSDQSAYGKLMDLNHTNRDVRPDTSDNRTLLQENPSAFDIVGIDSKISKKSALYKKALTTWRESSEYVKRWKKKHRDIPKEIQSPYSPKDWEIEHLPEELYGEFNTYFEYLDTTYRLSHPKDWEIEHLPEELYGEFLDLSEYESFIHTVDPKKVVDAIKIRIDAIKDEKLHQTWSEIVAEFGVDPYLTELEN